MEKSILYVEDEQEPREMIREVLAQQYPDLVVHVAGNGEEGLALFREHRPQLVITDIRMPVMDGLAMAREIRELDPEVELIALTAFSDTGFLVGAIELGFAHYVFKPIILKKLLAAVGKSVAVSDLRRQVQEQNRELRISEQRLQATFDQAAVGIGHACLDGTFLRINDRYCDITGCSPSTLPSIYDFTHPEDLPKCRAHHASLLQGETRSYSFEKRYVHDDGSIVWASLNVSMVRHPEGESFLVAIVDDITQRKELEEEIAGLNETLAARAVELEIANRDLKAFNYTVAHDLRQPLNVINGYCQAMQEVCGENMSGECREFIRETYQATVRMNRLVTVLLQFAEASDVELKREPVDLSAAAEDVAAELRRGEPERAVVCSIAPGLLAYGDPNLLRVVMANLLGNAWKYTAARAEALIEFGSKDVAGGRAFYVKDNGIGFDMKEAKEIFVPFRRLPGGRRAGGFGVGLGTVERIISRHGGAVWAEGEPGAGATFYFTLDRPETTVDRGGPGGGTEES